MHDLSPKSPLSELRKLKVSDVDLSKKSITSLTDSQKYNRRLALEVKRMMKGGKSLTESSGQVGLSKSQTLKYLGRAVKKKSGKWIPNTRDTIQRSMHIYEKGSVRSIVVTNSDDAQYIGEYYNAVRKYLETGDKELLKPFKRRTITDANGNKHKLETNPEKVRDIEDRKEDSEFWEVYSDE